MKRKSLPILHWISLKALIWSVLIVFLLLMFSVYRHNYPGLRDLDIPLTPFGLWLALSLALLVMKVKPGINWRVIFLFVVTLTAVILVKLPILNHLAGLFNSDDSVFGLMSRHFLDGKPTPLFFYGQLYLGTAYMLLNTLFFWFLGPSMFTMGVAALVLYAVFMVIQYAWIKEFFDRRTAVCVLVFYVFSGGILAKNIFSVGGNFPLVYVFCGLTVLLTLKVVIKDAYNYVYILGFLIGFGYWNHQITLVFSLVSIMFLLMKRNLKQIIALAVSIFVGVLPFLLFELSHQFINLKFIFRNSGEGQSSGLFSLNWGNLAQGLLDLFPGNLPVLVVVLIYGLSLAGLVEAVFRAVRFRRISAEIVAVAFLVSFLFIFLLSQFSKSYIPRYFMPLYVICPVFWLGFTWLKNRRLRLLFSVPVLLVLMISGFLDQNLYSRRLAKIEGYRMALFTQIKGLGEGAWYSTTYPDSYLFSLISREALTISNGQLERYLPYWLRLFNSPEKRIYLTGRKGAYLKKKLDYYGVEHYSIEKRPYWLFTGIYSPINLLDLTRKAPSVIPVIDIKKDAQGNIIASVDSEGLSTDETGEFRLNIKVTSPRYRYTNRKVINRWPMTRIIEIPDCFDGKTVDILTWLDHNGTHIPASKVTRRYEVFSTQISGEVIYLNGFGPELNNLHGKYRTRDRRMNNRVRIEGRNLRVIEKAGEILLPNQSPGKPFDLTFNIYSLIDFDKPIWKYLGLRQELTLMSGEWSKTYHLKYGVNQISAPLPSLKVEPSSKFIKIHVNTRFILPFVFEKLGYFETGVALESILLK